ncbi:undecaprenyl-diphosphatase UppP [Candidatus Blochmannia ocreatus (nom. nud.)]|uniref:Undecaprenyl-diphosphatase n=1 Tax=Candidatus Blochmannia ocreatus (nom. nud.) TaxID=251538 RepID=A0ABY4SW27_9ENTR|nr:undecaprenyl-diphosphatase UppP [Candidatus Blochmannia ocreatus]URJ25150.1 undecaprenyl-diphosphatase UppP [Candidatus Blochmannia ocreatus]
MYLYIHKLIIVFILGIVEGLTEFLPISSTGHMIMVKNLLNCTDDSMINFVIVIQFGVVISIVLTFWKKLCAMHIICINNFFSKIHVDIQHFCIQHILLGTFPGIILGIILYESIRYIFDITYIIYGLIFGSVFLLIGELYYFKTPSCTFDIDKMTYAQALLIGCCQCLAFLPGFSRSGATIGAGLLVGLNRRVSTEFSFFIAIPVIFGAIVCTIYQCRLFFNNIQDILLLIIGSGAAFVISFFTIKYFLKIIQKISFIPFIIYRILLAGFIYLKIMPNN